MRRPRSEGILLIKHSASDKSAYFVLNIVRLNLIKQIQVVGVESSIVEQPFVVQDGNLLRKLVWKHSTFKDDEWSH